MGKLILVLGGARSGKSTYAQKLAGEITARSGRVAYVATGVACDDEMRARIEQHRHSRPLEWATIEAPTEVAQAIQGAGGEYAVMIVDCLTTLITNWLAERGQLEEPTESMAELEKTILGRVGELVRAARGARSTVIMVSNEVGLGVVPGFKAGRVFRDLAGLANQLMAREADEVYVMWAGIPQKIKEDATRMQEMSVRARTKGAVFLKELVLITLFAALTALGARVAIPLPFTPVPVTLQVLFPLLAGLLLGSKRGALSQVEYVAAGLAGLPVFAKGGSGPAYFLGPTGGYLLGFVVAAFVVGELAVRMRASGKGAIFLASLGGVAVIYLCGALWLAGWLGIAGHLSPIACLTQAWRLGVLPFIAVDVAKALAVAAVTEGGRRWLELLQGGRYG
ncbi:MAG TPA: bifunctional adenosylcobinamide kinase/adenosylcobinamide-phosphate guanylyltransferase [Anaerolineae bacterium]|nr:bifunctional adenosylcobinamide kinase/adenosylcobinamide-phosphate guanylyltransferase [Anaerolineae bacterium]